VSFLSPPPQKKLLLQVPSISETQASLTFFFLSDLARSSRLVTPLFQIQSQTTCFYYRTWPVESAWAYIQKQATRLISLYENTVQLYKKDTVQHLHSSNEVPDTGVCPKHMCTHLLVRIASLLQVTSYTLPPSLLCPHACFLLWSYRMGEIQRDYSRENAPQIKKRNKVYLKKKPTWTQTHINRAPYVCKFTIKKTISVVIHWLFAMGVEHVSSCVPSGSWALFWSEYSPYMNFWDVPWPTTMSDGRRCCGCKQSKELWSAKHFIHGKESLVQTKAYSDLQMEGQCWQWAFAQLPQGPALGKAGCSSPSHLVNLGNHSWTQTLFLTLESQSSPEGLYFLGQHPSLLSLWLQKVSGSFLPSMPCPHPHSSRLLLLNSLIRRQLEDGDIPLHFSSESRSCISFLPSYSLPAQSWSLKDRAGTKHWFFKMP
jgi:hypothetical protein